MTPAGGLLVSYAFLFGVLFLGEIIRKVFKLRSEFTRKFIHVGVGFWGFVAYWTLDWWIVLIPPASFVLINLLSYKITLFKSMEIEDKSNLGTVYYPISLCVLLVAFWPKGLYEVALIGMLVMALGDGFASVVGAKWGKHRYRIWKREKSWEGSAAMFLFSALAVVLVLSMISPMPMAAILVRAAVVGLAGTVIEALSPWGTDNLTVPILCALFYLILF